jgi:hypothetical protein
MNYSTGLPRLEGRTCDPSFRLYWLTSIAYRRGSVHAVAIHRKNELHLIRSGSDNLLNEVRQTDRRRTIGLQSQPEPIWFRERRNCVRSVDCQRLSISLSNYRVSITANYGFIAALFNMASTRRHAPKISFDFCQHRCGPRVFRCHFATLLAHDQPDIIIRHHINRSDAAPVAAADKVVLRMA